MDNEESYYTSPKERFLRLLNTAGPIMFFVLTLAAALGISLKTVEYEYVIERFARL